MVFDMAEGLTIRRVVNSSLALALHSSFLDILNLFVNLWCSLTGKWLLKQGQSQAAAVICNLGVQPERKSGNLIGLNFRKR